MEKLRSFVVLTSLYHNLSASMCIHILCIHKPKSAEWTSRCAILHEISALLVYTPLHKNTYLVIPKRPQTEIFTTNDEHLASIHKK